MFGFFNAQMARHESFASSGPFSQKVQLLYEGPKFDGSGTAKYRMNTLLPDYRKREQKHANVSIAPL